jgi:hypothetical protein
MIATAVSLAIIAFVINAVADMAHRDGPKVLAALRGRSLVARHNAARPVIVRFSPRRRAVESAWPALRAAA